MIGIDIGIHHLLTLSNGVYIDVPDKSLASIEYACEAACSYGEDLVIERLNLFVTRYGTNQLPKIVTAYLNEEAARQGLNITTVSAINTSKVCCRCSSWVKTKKDRRVFCSDCNILECRDLNAAINIKKAGQGLFKPKPKRLKKEEPGYELETVVEGILYRPK